MRPGCAKVGLDPERGSRNWSPDGCLLNRTFSEFAENNLKMLDLLNCFDGRKINWVGNARVVWTGIWAKPSQTESNWVELAQMTTSLKFKHYKYLKAWLMNARRQRRANSLTFWFISKLNLEVNVDFFGRVSVKQTIRTIQERTRQATLALLLITRRFSVVLRPLSMLFVPWVCGNFTTYDGQNGGLPDGLVTSERRS